MNLPVSSKAANFLTRWATIGFPIITLLSVVSSEMAKKVSAREILETQLE
jgi:hypothetical protein